LKLLTLTSIPAIIRGRVINPEKKEMDMKQNLATPTETIIENADQTGLLKVLGCTFTPEADDAGHVVFRITGDVDGCLAKLYQNHPVGAMDVLQAIKSARQAIFAFRKGKGQRYENFNR
jgi:hypothetical protein